MNAEQIKAMIAARLACQHITLEGDGRHWFSTIVSPEFEGKRAIGVEYERGGQRQVARARREVVLSGGSINSVQLLKLSGIGPAAERATVAPATEPLVAASSEGSAQPHPRASGT